MADELVECHSGYTYAERPIALHWDGDRLEIVEVKSRWRIPEGLCFRVSVGDGREFELIYKEFSDTWSITII